MLTLQARITNLFDDQMSSHCSRCGFVETIYAPLLESLHVAMNTTPHLVLTNDIPMPMEATRTHSEINMVRQDLEKLDDGITTIEALLKDLHRGRQKIASHLRSLESIVSPIRRVPFEILSQIFLDAMDVGDKEGDSLDLAQVPLNLVRVSTVWRDVAVSLPQLWSTITIKFKARRYQWSGEDDCSPMKVLALKTWLSVSASHQYPISINVSAERNVSKLVIQKNNSLLSLLLSSSHYWRSVRFECPPHFLPFISSLEGRLPLLEALHFRLYSGLQLQAPMSAFSIAPSLCSIELGLISNQALLSLPWHQVTKLVLHRTDNILHILTHIPVLEELLLDNCRAPLFDDELVHLRYLRKLDVRDDLSLVKWLIVPSLVEMSLSSASLLATTAIVAHLHSHPEPHLTKLRIELDFRFFSDIAALLSATPTITYLILVDRSEININSAAETVLMSLTHRWQNASVLVPNLQSLEISFRHKFNIAHFFDMIESRWFRTPSNVNVTSLKTVHLAVPVEIAKSDAWRRLDVLKDEGLAFFLEAL
jgi:hypothetical protein